MAIQTLPEVNEQALTFLDAIPYEETDNPNIKAHIVNPPNNLHIWQPGMTSQEIVDIARSQGLEVVALCGRAFVPKHNPDKPDACEICIRIAGDLMRGSDE